MYTNPTEGWETMSEADQKRLGPFKEKLERLYRFGFIVIGFDPGVKFLDTNKMSSEEKNADTYHTMYVRNFEPQEWDLFDHALKEIEMLKNHTKTKK